MSQDSNKKAEMSTEEAFMTHCQLTKNLLFILKQLSKIEFYYWKGAGLFLLLSILLFVFKDHFFTSYPFLGTFLVGIGFLLLLAQNIRMDFFYRIQAATCIEQGVSLEKKHNIGTFFSMFKDNNLLPCQCNFASRLFPLGLIAITTAIAGVLVSMQINVWLAIVFGFFSIGIMLVGTRFYIRKSKKILEIPMNVSNGRIT